MLNKNFIKIAQESFFGGKNAGYTINNLCNQSGEFNRNAGNYGTEYSGVNTLLNYTQTKVYTSKPTNSGMYLAYGEGGSPANEYTLAKEIASGILSCSSLTKANIFNGVMYTSAITNVSDKDVTIAEIGLFMEFAYSTYYGQAMIGRIDSADTKELPVILKAGETKTFSYALKFN